MSRTGWVVATLIAVGLLVASERTIPRLRFAMKPLASAGFLGAALVHGFPGSSYGWLMLAGLCLGAVGDVTLLSADRAPVRGGLSASSVPLAGGGPAPSAPLLGGLAAFLAGHLAYVAAFAGLPWSGWWLTGALTVALGAGVSVYRILAPHLPHRLRGPVAAYMVVISVMVALGAGVGGAGGAVAIPIGATAFYLSDLAVARQQFLGGGFGDRVWGLPLYYGAQLLLASTVA